MGLTDGEDDRRDDKPAPLKRFLRRAENEVSADDEEAEENLADTVDVATGQMTLGDNTLELSDAAQGGRRRRQPTRRQGQGAREVARHQHPPERPLVDERVIIFTEYRATQNYLLQHLANLGYAEEID